MQESTRKIQPYDASVDAASVFALWQAIVGELWPLEPSRFQQILGASHAQHFVAREAGEVVGFVATSQSHRQHQWTGHLMLLLVHPDWQKQGIGTQLHETALQHLRVASISEVQLGGLSPRFWCGVPANLPDAPDFFRARGWDLSVMVYDLAQDLHQYVTPPAIYQRMDAQHITLDIANQESVRDLLSFEEREFPNWLMHYERCVRLGNQHDLLAARDQNGQVLGTLIMYTAQSHAERTDLIWQGLLGDDAGALGAVGVAASEQGRGIGIALVARASDLLKERGVRNCAIDWVDKTAFYAKLGYHKWRAYHVSGREL